MTRSPAPILPELKDGRFVFSDGDAALEVDPELGGRITALRLGGRDLLTGPEVDPANHGSTFWTSPQSAWGWPPVPEIDNAPYAAVADGPTLIMRGKASPALGVAVEKRFSVDGARGAFVLEYRIGNVGAAPIRVAPWEVTRVAAGGLTFFPTGTGVFPPSNLVVRPVGDVTWYAYEKAAVTDHQKVFADAGAGWVAHVDGDALLIKTFDLVLRPQHAPGEAQIEIYATPLHTYVEVEQQGAYDTLAPGGVLPWRVLWMVRRLPDGLPRAAGSDALVAFVRAQLG